MFGAVKTQHGMLCTPDSHAGCGPIYAAVLIKVAETEINRHAILGAVRDDSSEEEEEEEEEGVDVEGEQGNQEGMTSVEA